MMRFPGRMRSGVCSRRPSGILKDSAMQGRRFDRLLTGTAIALALGLTAAADPAQAQIKDQSAIEALVPMPEPANVPPPTAADIGAPETTGSTALVLPDPPDLPPPTFKDIAAPSAPPAPEAAPATVATPTPAAAPAPTLVAHPDQPIRDALRELVSSNRLAR